MKIQTFDIDPSGSLTPRTAGILPTRDEVRRGGIWLDAGNPTREELTALLDMLAVHPEVRERVLDPSPSNVTPVDGAVMFDLPRTIEGTPPGLKVDSFVILSGSVVTFRGIGMDTQVQEARELAVDLDLGGNETADLVASIVVRFSKALRAQSLHLRAEVRLLATRLEEDPGKVSLQEIMGLKRTVLDLEAAAEERESVLEGLATVPQDIFQAEALEGDLGDALFHNQGTIRMLDRTRSRIGDLQVRYDAHQQDLMNRRLSRLTVISAIFLPLTLIAGIYGMNFDVMPELHIGIAYPLTLAAMIGISLIMLWRFRAGGYFD